MMSSASSERTQRHIIVLGAGVVGLSTALRILDKGYDVTIIAENFPVDPKLIKYSSHWAGADHVSGAGDDQRQQKMDQETFQVMWEMSEHGQESEGCFLRLPEVIYYCKDKEELGQELEGLEFMPGFRILKEDELVLGSKCGVSFTTLTIEPPVYLNYLLSRFLGRGGRMYKASVQHISQAAEGAYSHGRKPDAIVVCVGISARFLGGVEDKDVYPIRGQTVLLRAPWIKFGRALRSSDGQSTYIIPRRSGDVIVGGTKFSDDWYPHPRPETSINILERVLLLCPELCPGHTEDTKSKPTIEDVKAIIIEEGCGLRPARNGGIRLETEVTVTATGRDVPIVHTYGHGGYGYQSSWGSASKALELLEEVFAK